MGSILQLSVSKRNMTAIRRGALLFAILAAAISDFISPVAKAEAVPCQDTLISVEAPTRSLAKRVCELASYAKKFISKCSLTQESPIAIEVRHRIESPATHCAGVYYKGKDRVAIVDPESVIGVMPSDSAFALIDRDIYYRSLIVHELAHALMDQSGYIGPICNADHEYVAYALQIESLPPAAQSAVTGYHSVETPVKPDWVNDFTLSFRPDLFAVYAWSHFNEAGNGCDFVKKLLAGEATFKSYDF